jgi:hypothetical protein
MLRVVVDNQSTDQEKNLNSVLQCLVPNHGISHCVAPSNAESSNYCLVPSWPRFINWSS